MTTALRSLLRDSLDYAGLFPPAELPLDAALNEYLDCRRRPQSWLLARFVCPASRLAELADVLPADSSAGPLRLSVVGRAGGASELEGLEADLNAIAALSARHGERVRVESYESPLPPDVSQRDAMPLLSLLERMRGRIERSAPAPLAVFLEGSLQGESKAELLKAASVVAGAGGGPVRFGWKVRLGGIDPARAPSAGDLARLVAACQEAGCFWKATAGLHQPLGSRDATGGRRFGFLSLFLAAALTAAHSLAEPEIEALLCEEDPRRFRFTDESVGWGDRNVTLAAIERARRTALLSFGSCSFEEPCEAIEKLMALPGVGP